LNGACVENVWQPMSAETCVSPISGDFFRKIFIARKRGRPAQPVPHDGGSLGSGGRTVATATTPGAATGATG